MRQAVAGRRKPAGSVGSPFAPIGADPRTEGGAAEEFKARGGQRTGTGQTRSNPGAYTAIVSGQGGVTGVCLIEAYDATVGRDSDRRKRLIISPRPAPRWPRVNPRSSADS